MRLMVCFIQIDLKYLGIYSRVNQKFEVKTKRKMTKLRVKIAFNSQSIFVQRNPRQNFYRVFQPLTFGPGLRIRKHYYFIRSYFHMILHAKCHTLMCTIRTVRTVNQMSNSDMRIKILNLLHIQIRNYLTLKTKKSLQYVKSH